MSNEADRPLRYVNPRPEIVKTLGVLNVVFSILISMCVSVMTGWYLLAVAVTPRTIEVPIPPSPGPVTATPTPSVATTESPATAGDGIAAPTANAPAAPAKAMVGATISVNPLFGLDDPAFIKFCVIDLVTALIVNLALFVSGVGLMTLKRWGMLWSNWVAGIKVARLIVLWSGFLFLVAPGLSEGMARSVVKMMPPNAKGPMPDVNMLGQVYLFTNAFTTAMVILFGVIYPVIALVIATRPGFRAALRREVSTKPATLLEDRF